jgi:hypothetical protein
MGRSQGPCRASKARKILNAPSRRSAPLIIEGKRKRDRRRPRRQQQGQRSFGCLKIESGRRGALLYLAPLAGRGRERSERVRGPISEQSSWRLPLTPTLSPHAGRGRKKLFENRRWITTDSKII